MTNIYNMAAKRQVNAKALDRVRDQPNFKRRQLKPTSPGMSEIEGMLSQISSLSTVQTPSPDDSRSPKDNIRIAFADRALRTLSAFEASDFGDFPRPGVLGDTGEHEQVFLNVAKSTASEAVENGQSVALEAPEAVSADERAAQDISGVAHSINGIRDHLVEAQDLLENLYCHIEALKAPGTAESVD